MPVLERLIREAPAARQRRFAIAAARLSLCIMDLDWQQDLRPVMLRIFEAAEALAAGAEPFAPSIVAARADAEALERQFDERQLNLIGEIEDETPHGSPADHPRYAAYEAAAFRHAAVEAAANAVHEDALTAAALNLEILHGAIRIDYDTTLILARHWLRPHDEPIERDAEAWPVFKRFPDE